MEEKILTCPIYWTHEGNEYTGTACYDRIGQQDDYIKFESENQYGGTDTFDIVSADDCEDGITLDDIWSDLLSKRDDDGRLNVTDIQLV